VRASALRLSERWLREPNHPIAGAVLALMGDASWTVRRQLAATTGELPGAQGLEAAVGVLARYGSDPIAVDAAVSGLRGREMSAMTRFLQTRVAARQPDPVAMLAGAVAKSGDSAGVQQLLAKAADTGGALWQRTAMLQGLEAGLTGGGGGRGGRGRGAPAPRGVTLPVEPADLLRIGAAGGELGAMAARVTARLEWPGKPAPAGVAAPPLTADEQKRFAAGGELYKSLCIACHQEDGKGREKLAPSLVGSRFVTGQDPGAAARILLGGKEGALGLMPPLGGSLTDEQIAAVLTYIRREWGHVAGPVEAEDVQEIRGMTRMRTRPWTDAELLQSGRGRGRGGQ
jgi:mono/diheme cytochrome c family protein